MNFWCSILIPTCIWSFLRKPLFIYCTCTVLTLSKSVHGIFLVFYSSWCQVSLVINERPMVLYHQKGVKNNIINCIQKVHGDPLTIPLTVSTRCMVIPNLLWLKSDNFPCLLKTCLSQERVKWSFIISKWISLWK